MSDYTNDGSGFVERGAVMGASAGSHLPEALGEDEDDGTMPENVAQLSEAVVGRRIVSAERETVPGGWGSSASALVLTLDDRRRVILADTDDCCAYTELQGFFLDPKSVDHAVLGVSTTGGYTTWHIVADFGDVMRLDVGWSCGNPFYYSYGFDIRVEDIPVEAAAEPAGEGGVMDDRGQALRNIVATSEEAELYDDVDDLQGLVLTESGWQADPVFLPAGMHVQFDGYGRGWEATVFTDSDPGGPAGYMYFKDLPEAAEWVRWMKDRL